jgi:REP element-mobilizing transposase RayT
VTICVQRRASLLASVNDGSVDLSPISQSVGRELDRLTTRIQAASVDASVVMPNHLHAIISINPVVPGTSLGEIVRTFKAASTHAIRRECDRSFAWQRNDHERVIRDERELHVFSDYIATNPTRWSSDVMYVPWSEGRFMAMGPKRTRLVHAHIGWAR